MMAIWSKPKLKTRVWSWVWLWSWVWSSRTWQQ